jgi:tRNA1(Val) A37 N6-methylase TrmN6
MKEILRTNDPVRLSWLTALLAERNISAIILDTHTSVLEGQALAIPRRLMVADDDFEAATRVLADAGEISADASLDVDRLLDGRVVLRQPEGGYRVAIDSVLLAAAVPAIGAGTVLDVGAGVGATALCYAARVPGARVVGLEKQAEMVEIARENAAANRVGDRVTFYIGDLLDPPAALRPGAFDHVMANPPYLPPQRGALPPDPAKAVANVEGEADLAAWLEFCFDMVAVKGTVTVIHRADRLDELLALLRAVAGGIVVFPLWPRLGEPAKRVVVRARKGVRTPLRLAAGLVLHREGARYTEAAESVLRKAEPLPL